MQVAGISRAALVAMSVIAILLFVVGGAWAASFLTQRTDTRTRNLPAASALTIDGRVGDILVVGSNRRDVRLTTKEKRSVFGRTHVKTDYEDGHLELDSHCSGMRFVANTCAVSYRLEVPRDMAVTIDTATGDVRAENLRGDADLRTRTGDVHAIDIEGRLRLHTSTGDIHADTASVDVEAGTSTGDVRILAPNATDVKAQTNTGDIDLDVPDRTYAIHTQTTTGDQHVNVDDDDKAPRHLSAVTTTGDVSISPNA